MARSFFGPDDEKKGKKPRRIFTPEAMPADAARADLRAMIPPLQEEKGPAWTDSSITGLRQDPGHVGQRPPPAPPTPGSMMRAGVAVEDRSEPVSWDKPEGLEDAPGITKALWYASRVHGEVQGTGNSGAEEAFATLKYIFEPPQTPEEWAAYKEWATSTASWSEMPKGALGVELPADLAATIPGVLLGARDIAKDFANDEQSFWNVFDALGVLPVLGLVATGGRAFRHGDDIGRAVKEAVRQAKRMEDVKLVRRVSPSHADDGSRSAAYIFDTPKGQVEVSVAEPGTHTEVGYLDRDDHRVLLAPEGVEVAEAEETLWTAIRMVGGSYTRGSEGVLGNAITKQIFSQLGEMYPDAKWVGGGRVTGSSVADGPASAGGRQTMPTWVYMGERADGQSAHRTLQRMADENPEAYAKALEEAKALNIDISPEALRKREADMVARGLPSELRPAQLRVHEREVERIMAQNAGDYEDGVAEALDYLDAQGIKAIDEFSGEPTRLGIEIINGTGYGGTGRDRPMSEILNPMNSTDDEIKGALTEMMDEGIDTRTGQISPRQQYIANMQDMWGPRIESELQRMGFDVDDVVLDFDMTGERGFDILNVFDENGDSLLHMKMERDNRYAAGVRVQELTSTQGDNVLQPLADRLTRLDVGVSEDVQALTTVGRERAAAEAVRRAQPGARGTAGQDAVEYAARLADEAELAYGLRGDELIYDVRSQLLAGSETGDALYTVGEVDEIMDALEAVGDGRTSSRQTWSEMVRGVEPVDQRTGVRLTNQYGETASDAAMRRVVDYDGDQMQAAMELVSRDGFGEAQARAAVDAAMDEAGYGASGWAHNQIRELADAARPASTRVEVDPQALEHYTSLRRTHPDASHMEITDAMEALGWDAPQRMAARNAYDRAPGAMAPEAQRIAEGAGELQTGTPRRRPADDSVARRELEEYRESNRRNSPIPPSIQDQMNYLRRRGHSEDEARRVIGVGAERQGEQIGGTEEMIGARPPRYPNQPRWSHLDPEDPDNRYVSVYRRHTDPRATLSPDRATTRTGREGAERRRRETYPEYYHARTPFYVKGQAPETQFDSMPIQIEARIPESRIYDINLDPKGYVKRWHDGEYEDFTMVEDAIKRDGDYAALADYERGQVWAFDEVQETHRVNLQDGTWYNSDGSRLDPNDTPLSARGILTPSQMGGDPVETAAQLRPLGVTEMQQRSRIRQGTAAQHEMQAWPELAGAEAGQRGDMLFDEARRLWSDESGEKVVPGQTPNPDRRSTPRAELPPEKVAEARRLMTEWGVPSAQEGAEPAHWGLVRRAAQGEGGDVDLDRMAEVQRGMVERSRSYDELRGEHLNRREAELAAGHEWNVEHGYAEPQGRGAGRLGEAPTEVTDWDIEMAELLNSGEGTTQRLDGRKPPRAERYIVSPDKGTETIFKKGEVTPVDVALFREAHGGALENGYFGAWVDGDDVYMDVSRGFRNRKAAMEVAMAGDQQSIADLRKIEAEDWDNAFPKNPYYDEAQGRTQFPTEREETMVRSRVFDHMPELEAAREEAMLRSMSPANREWFENSRSHVQDRVREMHRMQLAPEDLAAIMALGQQTRGWYKGAAGSIGNAFGQDAFQFSALLAATSPNVPVSSNTRFALDLWAEWNQWNRPRDPEVIQQLFDSVAEGSGIFKLEGHQVVPNANLNTIEVLSHPEPVEWFSNPENWARGGMLSGAKVDPFFANVVGELDRMTVDTHQLKYIAAPDNSLSRRAATEAAFTQGADELARQLEMPEGLQVAEGQEMSWEVIRQLSEMSGRGRGSMEDMVFDEAGNVRGEVLEELDARMAQAEDFSQFMDSDEARALIGYGGGDPQFEAVHRTGVADPERAREIALERPQALRRGTRRADMTAEGDYLMQAAPWLVGGGAGILGRHFANQQQEPEAEVPSLFQLPKKPGGFF